MSQIVDSPRQSRLEQLQSRLKAEGLAALLISEGDNRRYISGFSGSSGWVVVHPGGCALVTDGRYWAQVDRQCPGVELVKFRAEDHKSLGGALALWLAEHPLPGKLGFEAQNLTVATLEQLRSDVPGVELEATRSLVEEIRQVKADSELELLGDAAARADQALRKALESFQPGVKESDFCLELEYQMRKFGARKPSFDSIVASGPNGAYPHAGVTDRAIAEGELVTVDFGAHMDHGYVSDMTRTIWLGRLDGPTQELYLLVRRAHRAAMDAVRAGRTTREIDAAARDLITAAGHGPAFSHGLGHGVGLAVHELPSVRSTTDTQLLPGMVITIEPGVYLPGQTGCRVEDTVVVTAEGHRSLTHSPYQEPGQTHPLEAY